jgi:segregation and condensation protein B
VSDQEPVPSGEQLLSAVGAVIFASEEPVPPKEIAAALGGVELRDVQAAIQTLQEEFDRLPCGLRVEWIAGGPRLSTRPEVGEWVRRFFRHRNQRRLSPGALETLAIIAYRQPVTAPEIQAVRGKDPAAALKGLLERKLIRIEGRKKVVGNPLLYGTTKQFLVHFGLNRLEDLPSIEEFDRFLEALGPLAATEGSEEGTWGDEAATAAASGDAAPAQVEEPSEALSGPEPP